MSTKSRNTKKEIREIAATTKKQMSDLTRLQEIEKKRTAGESPTKNDMKFLNKEM